jgi:hypothetical protein
MDVGIAVILAALTQAPPAYLTRLEFKQLHWLTGTWRGSGLSVPEFYEEYAVRDDSTLVMRTYADSTFSVATDSSTIEWRNGAVHSRGTKATYVVIAFSPSSVRFMRPGAWGGGHTFRLVSGDEWTATLHPERRRGKPTIYTMQRVRRDD